MNWYSLALFAHIVGVLTLFGSMAVQWLIALRLRHATTNAQVREWSGLNKGVNRLAPVTAVLILGAGMYMTLTVWSMTTWVIVSLAAMVVMMIFSMGVASRQVRAIQRETARAAEADPETISPALRARLHAPALWVSMQIALAVGLSIVFMMTTKPSLAVSIAAVGVALVLGALIGALTLRPLRPLRPLRAQRQLRADLPAEEAHIG